jgi:phage repressor protein C with HTH and peptisase S24 domain
MEERRKNRAGSGERRKADAERIADELKKRGHTSVHVRGTSLLPLMRPGDVAMIRRDKLENMRSGDVVLMQRGDHLIAKRIGDDEDGGSAETSREELLESGAEGQDVSGRSQELRERPELLGKIVGVRREKDKIKLGTKKKTTEAVDSVVLRPARWSEG